MWKKLSLKDEKLIKEFADLMENHGCKKKFLKLKIDESVIKHNLTIPNSELFLFKNDVFMLGLGFRYNKQKNIMHLLYVANKFLKDNIDYDYEYERIFNIASVFFKDYLKGKKVSIVFGGSGDPTEVHDAHFLTRPEWKESISGIKIRDVKFKKGAKIINKIEIEEL